MKNIIEDQKNKIAQVVTNKSVKGFIFKPDQAFYNEVGINKHRFAQLWRGQKEPLQSELQSIADYFKFDISELF